MAARERCQQIESLIVTKVNQHIKSLIFAIIEYFYNYEKTIFYIAVVFFSH